MRAEAWPQSITGSTGRTQWMASHALRAGCRLCACRRRCRRGYACAAHSPRLPALGGWLCGELVLRYMYASAHILRHQVAHALSGQQAVGDVQLHVWLPLFSTDDYFRRGALSMAARFRGRGRRGLFLARQPTQIAYSGGPGRSRSAAHNTWSITALTALRWASAPSVPSAAKASPARPSA